MCIIYIIHKKIKKSNKKHMFLYNICMENMKPLKVTMTVTIEENVLEKLKEYAEKDERTLSSYVNLVLKKYVKEIEYED